MRDSLRRLCRWRPMAEFPPTNSPSLAVCRGAVIGFSATRFHQRRDRLFGNPVLGRFVALVPAPGRLREPVRRPSRTPRCSIALCGTTIGVVGRTGLTGLGRPSEPSGVCSDPVGHATPQAVHAIGSLPRPDGYGHTAVPPAHTRGMGHDPLSYGTPGATRWDNPAGPNPAPGGTSRARAAGSRSAPTRVVRT